VTTYKQISNQAALAYFPIEVSQKEVTGAFRSARPAITLWKAEDRIGFMPTGSFFGKPLASVSRSPLAYVHIFKNKGYLDSKIGCMLAWSGKLKSNPDKL